MSPPLVNYTPPQLTSLRSSRTPEAERQSLFSDDIEEKSGNVGNATTNRIIDHITQVVSSVAATRQTTPSSNTLVHS